MSTVLAEILSLAGNLATTFCNPTKSQGVYMVKPLVENNNDKLHRPMRIMSVGDLRKALSNADNVTTKHQLQGIWFLAKVSNAENIDPKSIDGKSGIQTKKARQYEEYLKKRAFSTTKVKEVPGKQEPEAKRKKNIQNPNDLIELDIDD